MRRGREGFNNRLGNVEACRSNLEARRKELEDRMRTAKGTELERNGRERRGE